MCPYTIIIMLTGFFLNVIYRYLNNIRRPKPSAYFLNLLLLLYMIYVCLVSLQKLSMLQVFKITAFYKLIYYLYISLQKAVILERFNMFRN